MPVVPRNILKQYFLRGDRPTEAQFDSLLDSTVNIIDDRYLLGLRTYDSAKLYIVGDTMIYNGSLYVCIANTTGVFTPTHWQIISSLGAVVYTGTWDASTNTPELEDGTGTKGFYYVVSAPGNVDFGSGTIDFQVSDWVIYNGTIWQKVDNSNSGGTASDIEFTPDGDITATNVQDAIVQVRDTTDIKLAAKQNVIALTPNYYPFAANANTLADGSLLNEVDGVVLDSGKVFRSIIPGKSQIDFPAANSVIISTDGGVGAEAMLTLDPDAASLKRTGYGELSIGAGDSFGEILLTNSGSNGIRISNNDVQLVNAQGNGARFTIFSTGETRLQSDNFIINSATNFSNLNPSTVPYLDGGRNLISSSVTTNELDFLSGVSSPLQAQLDNKLRLTGGSMLGDLLLNANPSQPLGAATKQYVDAAVSGIPPQEKSIALPFTFFVNDGNFAVSSLNIWTRLTSSNPILQMRVAIPPPGSIFPGTTKATGQLVVDYMTSAGTEGRVGLYDYTRFGAVDVIPGTDFPLPTSQQWGVIAGPVFPLINGGGPLTAGRTVELLLRKNVGGIGATVSIECATLIVTYS